MILLLTVFCSSNNNATPPQNQSVLRYDDNPVSATTPLPKRRLAAALEAAKNPTSESEFWKVIDGLADSPLSSLASSRRSSNGSVERN